MPEVKSMTFDPKEDGVALVPTETLNEPVGPMVAISAMALTMALKYHDINTVQDGALYQQYKLEGKNMHGLHLDMVFETAIQIEQHLVSANARVAKMLFCVALAEGPRSVESPEAEGSSEPSADTVSS